MNILYFDAASGISGDMCVGALLDLGVDFDLIKDSLAGINIRGYSLKVTKEKRKGIVGTRFIVELTGDSVERNYLEIKALIEASALDCAVKALGLKIFEIIAVAEGCVHGVAPEEVHFHEVGAVDSIIDIMAAAIAISSLKVDCIRSSPIPLGSGLVETQHGTMPIPAPATVEILRGVDISSTDICAELTTPTGAAIISALSSSYGPIPAMKIEKIAYGVGSADFDALPNLLRVFYGEESATCKAQDIEMVTVIETNIDDLSPQIEGFLMEKLFEAGALDVYFTSVQMKKSRPGVLLTAIAEEEDLDVIMEVIFKESTTIGVRYHNSFRNTLERRVVELDTSFGSVRIKESLLGGKVVNRQPEYEDLKAATLKTGQPLKEIREEVMALVHERLNGKGRK